jgi:hypothetical protein
LCLLPSLRYLEARFIAAKISGLFGQERNRFVELLVFISLTGYAAVIAFIVLTCGRLDVHLLLTAELLSTCGIDYVRSRRLAIETHAAALAQLQSAASQTEKHDDEARREKISQRLDLILKRLEETEFGSKTTENTSLATAADASSNSADRESFSEAERWKTIAEFLREELKVSREENQKRFVELRDKLTKPDVWVDIMSKYLSASVVTKTPKALSIATRELTIRAFDDEGYRFGQILPELTTNSGYRDPVGHFRKTFDLFAQANHNRRRRRLEAIRRRLTEQPDADISSSHPSTESLKAGDSGDSGAVEMKSIPATDRDPSAGRFDVINEETLAKFRNPLPLGMTEGTNLSLRYLFVLIAIARSHRDLPHVVVVCSFAVVPTSVSRKFLTMPCCNAANLNLNYAQFTYDQIDSFLLRDLYSPEVQREYERVVVKRLRKASTWNWLPFGIADTWFELWQGTRALVIASIAFDQIVNRV